MTVVSRDVVRAVLKSRDQRHHETNAVLVAMFQALVAELVEQGHFDPAPLAQRLTLTEAQIASDPNGTTGRDMLGHVTRWLNDLTPGLPPAHPMHWQRPEPPDGPTEG